MNKPIQAVDVSNMVQKPSSTAARTGSGEDDATSFSRVLSENEVEPVTQGSPQTAQESGKKLPPRDAPDVEQPQDKVESHLRTEIVTQAHAAIDSEESLPVEPSDEAGILEALVRLAEGGKDFPVQQSVPVEQPAMQVVEIQTVNLTAVAVKLELAGQPPGAGTQLPPQALESLQVLQSGHAGAVPGTEHLLQVDGRAAAERLLPAEIPVRATAAESTASAVREAVQLAVAGQGASDGLKQSLSEGRNFQPDLKVLAAQNQTETGSAMFSQALTDNSLALPSSKVQIPVGQPGWGRAVGQHVVWFVSQNISAANLRLNPQQLGPMEMQVSIEGDKATVAFISQHAVVREALEAAIPRLREMLAENGLNLANVNVSQQGNSGQHDQASDGSREAGDAANSAASDGEVELAQGLSPEVNTILGLVDYYV